MKKILLILLGLVFVNTALAQNSTVVRNDSASSDVSGTNLGVSFLSTDIKGQLYTTTGTGAAALGKAEDAAHASGDTGVMCLGVRNDTFSARSGTDGDYTPIFVTSTGAVVVEVTGALTTSSLPAAALLKAEDSASADADVGVNILSVRQGTAASSSGTDGDYQAIKSDGVGAIYVHEIGGTLNGLTVSSTIAAGSNNATNLKASAGNVYFVQGCNTTAATARYIKLYNKATAPTCGTDVPTFRLLVPANSCITANLQVGYAFGTGIGFCMVTGAADSDNTAVTASDMFLNIGYK